MKIIREHVTLSEDELFVVSIFEGDEIDLSYPFHQHEKAYELTITLGLTGTRMVGDHTSQFSGEDVVLIAPGTPHCWQDHGIQDKTNSKIVVIQFLDTIVSQQLLLSKAMINVKKALENAAYGLELKGSDKRKVLQWMAALEFENTFDTYIFILKVLKLFGKIELVKRLCSHGYVPATNKNGARRLETVLQYIQKNYSRKLLVAEVADQIHMSPSAFSHYFKKHTLKSFASYLMEMRLGKAAQLLQHSELPVGDVSVESGFQNVSHFNRSFSKYYNTTPLKFRKQLF
ncbi:AraC family transcriptional regulator [Spongiivirga sp. MCCC 1A20706]|uniref:AraC family transcriptional regulator n=1 Tax=Spongiivirga sp. MCCC 1A20706 TaxID=3160963 RepID=UPI0039778B42